jgi:hypothetical protein
VQIAEEDRGLWWKVVPAVVVMVFAKNAPTWPGAPPVAMVTAEFGATSNPRNAVCSEMAFAVASENTTLPVVFCVSTTVPFQENPFLTLTKIGPAALSTSSVEPVGKERLVK